MLLGVAFMSLGDLVFANLPVCRHKSVRLLSAVQTWQRVETGMWGLFELGTFGSEIKLKFCNKTLCFSFFRIARLNYSELNCVDSLIIF